jgi:hypothetical protein
VKFQPQGGAPPQRRLFTLSFALQSTRPYYFTQHKIFFGLFDNKLFFSSQVIFKYTLPIERTNERVKIARKAKEKPF